ncbi:hypothetical protein SO802_023487 [Lithocarpus litseifolius]|uniref:Pentatricopeptide repeat-containing protein n=1 Tax=Lithocarpus litseifolius TaxID=425828 RepID=A0AAW2CA98_9ROSI
MIAAYMQGGCPEKALSLFSDMNRSGLYASEVTFASVLGSCGAVLALCLSRLVHGLIVKYGFVANISQTTVRPFNFTFCNALNACSSIFAQKEGKQIHGVAIEMGLEDDEVVSRPLMDMYFMCGKLENAHRVFEQLGSKDLISWTSIVSGYATSGKTREAKELFDQMPDTM